MIWKVDGFSRVLVVFLHTDHQITQRTNDGTSKRIYQQCFDAVKRYDEFNYLSKESFRLNFYSKENLDKNYKGNLFFYWR